MAHPRLRSFFSGAVDNLRSAYRQTEGSSASTAGSLREARLRRVFECTLPANTSLHCGDIIDPFQNDSGQLDGILIHSFGNALAVDRGEPALALAEAVIAVIESKSLALRLD